jgi:hypothetical protein
MQESRMLRKIKMVVEGTELKELVKFGEVNQEDITGEVPLFDRIVTIVAGVEKIAPIPLTFRIERDNPTTKFLKTWRNDREVKDVTVVEVDGHGIEYNRLLISQCELANLKLPEYGAEAPVFAQIEVTLLPTEILPIS